MEMATAGMSEDTNNSVGTSEAEMLVRAHYETLKHMARAKRRRAGAGLTMQTTDLLHECWLKLRRQQEWRDEAHFMNTAALAMRQVLVDYARSKLAGKRHAVGGASAVRGVAAEGQPSSRSVVLQPHAAAKQREAGAAGVAELSLDLQQPPAPSLRRRPFAQLLQLRQEAELQRAV